MQVSEVRDNNSKEKKEVIGLWTAYKVAYSYKYSRIKFMIDEGWEKGFAGPEMESMKAIFCDQLEGHRYADFYAGRWKAGLFDSVDTYLTVGPVFTPNLRERTPPSVDLFVDTGRCQREDPQEPCEGVHLLYDDLCGSWGTEASAWAWRERKEGSIGYASPGGFCSLGYHGSAPQGVERCQFTPEGIIILYPYLEDPREHEGLVLKPHLWNPPSTYKIPERGATFLGKEGEVHCDVLPSIVLETEAGCWEVAREGECTITIRPRVCAPQKERFLDKFVSLKYVQVSRDISRIIYRKEGHLQPHAREGGVVTIETGYRAQGDLRREFSHDLVRYSHGGEVIVLHKGQEPPPRNCFRAHIVPKFGVKAYYEKGGQIFLFKDGQKKWDFIGGKVDRTDLSTVHALRREISEETGVSYGGRCVYLGLSQEGEWTSALYKIDEFIPKRGKFSPWLRKMDVVQWLPRLVSHVLFAGGKEYSTRSSSDASLSVRGHRLLEAIARYEDKGKKYHFRISRGKDLFPHRSSAHALFFFKAFVKFKPLSIPWFVDSVRQEYRNSGYSPPDAYQVLKVAQSLVGYVTADAPFYEVEVVEGSDVSLLQGEGACAF